MKKQKILFLGAGRMAEAVIAGLLRRSQDEIAELIVANRRSTERLLELRETYGVTIVEDWKGAVAGCDTIVLAMPPGAHRDVLTELAPHVNGQFVVTVAAGVGTELLEAHLPAGTPVAWVMPNTAAMIGESISLYAFGKHAGNTHKDVLRMILASIGEAAPCTEEQIRLLTAVTGSAPAFLYRFVEILEGAAAEFGIAPELARKLVVQMVFGSAAMLKEGTPPAELRDAVTTPGGATAAGLRVLDEGGLEPLLREAVRATNHRAEEMAGE